MMASIFRPRRLATMLLFGVLLVTALPTLAAPGGVLTSYSLNEAECYVDVTAQVEDAGYYAINMWDDGNFRAGAGSQVEAGGTLRIRFTIGNVILQGAAGIGVYLEDQIGLAVTTTYDSDGSAQLWSDTVGLDCLGRGFTFGATNVSAGADGDPCLFPLPTGSFVYSIPDGARAYYAADPNTYTGFNLPAGTWYVSEFTGDFAKVWIACSANPIYIPAINVVR
jgi:hypothetical protein